ncbi:MAG TPA: hypothetical protein VGL38_00180 [bacterium]|jgi:hypothetical protein
MLRLPYFFLIFVLTVCAFAQPNSADSTLKVLSARVELLSHRTDSLQGQLDKHAVEEHFFASGLAVQTGLFSAIVVIGVAIGGFLTFSRFKGEVSKITQLAQERSQELATQNKAFVQQIMFDVQTLRQQSVEFERQSKEQLTNVFYTAWMASANVYHATAEIESDRKQFARVFMSRLSGALVQSFLTAYCTDAQDRAESQHKYSHLLDKALEALTSISEAPGQIEILRSLRRDAIFHLDKLHESGDEIVRDICGQMRAMLTEYLKREPGADRA